MHPDFQNNNLKNQLEAERSHYKFYQQLARLRQNEIFTTGGFRSRVLNDKVLAYHRMLDDQKIFGILISFSSEPTEVDVTNLQGIHTNEVKVVLATSTSKYKSG
jgi:alpha-glucosidase